MANKNFLTVDVEDWTGSSLFLLSEKEAQVARQYLTVKDEQVDRGVKCLLDLLEGKNFNATFFVLGNTAKAHKELVRLILARGHEVASHTMNHALLPGLSPEELEYQLVESKKLLEDIIGAQVLGFRAPNLSGYPDVPLFFDMLQSAGYRYDSSFSGFSAVKILGQNVPGFPVAETNGSILEFPVTMTNSILFKVPMGGTFLKLMTPYKVSCQVTRNNRENKPAVLFFHTYEVAGGPICWAHPSPSLSARVSTMLRNLRKGHHLEVLNYLFSYHSFTSIKKYLDSIERS